MRFRGRAALAAAAVIAVTVALPTIAVNVEGKLPPFPTVGVYAYGASAVASCATSRSLAVSGWSGATGVGRLAGTVGAKGCGSVGTMGRASTASWDGGWDLAIPVHLQNSTRWVNATWRVSWTETNTVSISRWCAGHLTNGSSFGYLNCRVSASVSMYLITFLVDSTSGVFYAAGATFPTQYNFSFAVNTTACAPTCTSVNSSRASGGISSGNTTLRFDFAPPTVNASHAWELAVYAAGTAYASVTTSFLNFTGVVPLAATAVAVWNTGTTGHAATLLRVTTR